MEMFTMQMVNESSGIEGKSTDWDGAKGLLVASDGISMRREEGQYQKMAFG